MDGNFMMHDVRFPFYDTESGRFVVYKEKVYRFNFVGYMTFKNREGLNPLSPDTLAAYLEQLEPERKDVGQLMIEAEPMSTRSRSSASASNGARS